MKEQIKVLPLVKIHSSKLNPRKTFPQEPLQELADSIKEKGLIEPIIVRPSKIQKDKFEIVVGERRFRASKLIKAKTIKAIVRDLTDSEVRIQMLIENDQREDLTNLERGQIYADEHDKHGTSFNEIAKWIGKSKRFVIHHYQLVKKLSPAVKSLMVPKKGGAQGTLDYAIARELTDLPQKEQEIIAEKTIDYGWTRDQVVKVKKHAEELEATLERVQDPKFRKKLETEYLPKKFDPTALPRMQVEILKKQKLWVEKPKFEADFVPFEKKGEYLENEYPKRVKIIEAKGADLAEINQAKAEIDKLMQENPDIHYWIILVKL